MKTCPLPLTLSEKFKKYKKAKPLLIDSRKTRKMLISL